MKVYTQASFIVKTLVEKGYVAYFAGGWVRDHLLGKEADEIDIATDAPPEVITDLFPKTISVGIAFGVILVIIDHIQFEVSTFRRDREYKDGRRPEGVIFSSPKEDAQRRDFTINGMFYDPLTKTIFDFIGGREDLKKKVIRAIGDPEKRFEEDRLRMIRAVRFSSRLGFPILQQTERAIIHHAKNLLPAVSMERIWQELCKMAKFSNFDQALIQLYRLGLLQVIFKELEGTSQKEIVQRVSFFSKFAEETPPMLYLIHLFPGQKLSFYVNLCHYLKTSTEEVRWVEFFVSSQCFFHEKKDLIEWAHFYADQRATVILAIQLASLTEEEKMTFIKEHQNRQTKLASHIERIQKRTPLVTSSHLKECGIKPGKRMGELLAQAEEIAIEEDLDSPKAVLDKLFNERC